MFAGINWLAVLVAGGVFFGLGALWYSVLFGRKWAQLLSIDWENPGGHMGLIFGLTLAFELLASCAMAVLIRDSGFHGWRGGLHVGLMVGLGIVLPVIAINNLYQRRAAALTAIDAGHMTVGLALVGIILGAWR